MTFVDRLSVTELTKQSTSEAPAGPRPHRKRQGEQLALADQRTSLGTL
jgi:hypothetical protein